MNICITSTGDSLNSEVDPRFGRCQYFIIVNPKTLEFEAVENATISATGGAGVVSGQFVAAKNVTAVLTGNVGPNVFQTLEAADVKIITGVSGTIKEVIERYNSNGFAGTTDPTVESHAGMK